jgi:kynureninase
MAALEAALHAFDGVELQAARVKSEQLTATFIELVEDLGIVVTPKDARQRGSQVCLRIPGAERLIDDLMLQGIIGDYRPPDVARFGFSPLYIGFLDVWRAAAAIRDWH